MWIELRESLAKRSIEVQHAGRRVMVRDVSADPDLSKLRVALVHYWLVNRRGAERVLEAFCELFPQADIFALVADHQALSATLKRHRLTTSFLQKIPGSHRRHQYLLPLYPLALEQFDLRGYDLVISSESGPAKGVLTDPATLHICYCHTPMRYIWDFYPAYMGDSNLGTIGKLTFALTAHYARIWDVTAAARVDHFVAISHYVAERIRKFYRRDADVIYPPVPHIAPFEDRTSATQQHPSTEGTGYYLVVGQMVQYKRVDLAVSACTELGRALHVVGTGEEIGRLRRLAGPSVQFLDSLSDDEVRDQYRGCRALLFPGEEDLGATPLEAQAFGKPVIAYGKGGVRETVIPMGSAPADEATGVFFDQPDVQSMVEAIQTFEAAEERFRPEAIREKARRFGRARFMTEMTSFITQKLTEHRSGGRSKERLSAAEELIPSL